MDPNDRLLAERVLRHLFVGSQLNGLEFGLSSTTTKILFEHYSRIDNTIGTLYLIIESSWCISETSLTYEHWGELSNQEDEGWKQLYENRRQKVVDITLDKMSPHLTFTLENGKFLYVYGFHEQYESWQAGVQNDSDWLVVAAPNNEITLWCPEEVEIEDF